MAWEIDPTHTEIGFAAKHMMVTTVRGRFHKFSGVLDLDEPNPANSRVDVTIETGSITTGAEQRDAHLRSADFFDAEQYPTITFKSTKVTPHGDSGAEVVGDLTIKGVTRPVTLDVTREGRFNDLYGGVRESYTATTTISRKDWDLTWNVALENGGWLVSDQIKITIDTQVVNKPATAAAEADAETTSAR